jgi:flagellar biosynthetic protein FliR
MPSPETISSFLMVVVRCLSFFAIGPLFTHQKVPAQVQAIAAVATAVVLYPALPLPEATPPATLLGFSLSLGKEVLLGGLLGLVAGVVFAGISFAGELVGLQMGFAIANVFDPVGSEQVPLLGRMQELMAVFLFLLADGHHIFLRGLSISLERVPPGGFVDLAALPAYLLPMGASIFFIALQVGAPILAALFLTDAALGFVARAVPQMNIFLVGIPVKIFVGMLFLTIATPLLASLLRIYSNQMETRLLAILGGM